MASANSRHTERRQAAKLLNELLVQVGADALRLNTDGAPCVDVLAKVLRVLDRRCSGETVRPVFEAAVRKYVSNGGLLPEGVCLHPERGLELAVDSAAEAPLVSKHKLLLRSFAFKSKAFMCTYNCRDFTPDVWEEFEKFVAQLYLSGTIETSVFRTYSIRIPPYSDYTTAYSAF